ncbi:MAG: hypothetical protein Q8P20_00320 [bacterium]|nr:hypothetical protein [bacterium]
MKNPTKPKPIKKPIRPVEPKEFEDVVVYRTPTVHEQFCDNYEGLSEKEKIEVLLENCNDEVGEAKIEVLLEGFDHHDGLRREAEYIISYDDCEADYITNYDGRILNIKKSSFKEIYEFVYWPCGDSVSMAEILKKHPQLALEKLVISAEAWRHQGSSDSDIEIIASYPAKRKEYDQEMMNYRQAVDEFQSKSREYAKAAKQHKADLAKYRNEVKAYKKWRKSRIKELEASGAL